MTKQISSKALLDKKAELQAQVKAAHFLLAGTEDEPQIAQDVLTLRVQQAKMESQVAYLNTTLNRLNGQIPALANGQHKMLLQAITAQRWYAIKNIPEVLYDSHTGYLWPSFHYGFEMPIFSAWKEYFSLGDIGQGKWHRSTTPAEAQILVEILASYPLFEKLKNKPLFGYYNENGKPESAFCENDCAFGFKYSHFTSSYSSDFPYSTHIIDGKLKLNEKTEVEPYILPYCTLYFDARITPDFDSFSAIEKAQMVLDLFLKEGWQPVFDLPEYEKVYQTIQQHPKLLQELDELEGAIEEAINDEAMLHQPLSSKFDFLIDLQKYNPAEIDQSSLKYSHSLYQWADQLLNKIDEFSRQHHNVIERASNLHKRLQQNQKISRFKHIGNSSQLLVERDELIKNSLEFDLDKVRSKLINIRRQAKELQKQMDDSALSTDFFADLTRIQNAPRPDFIFVAEYTAQLVLKEVQHLEWLESHQAGLERLMNYHFKGLEAFNVFASKDRDEFMRVVKQEQIKTEAARVLFNDWARQRLIIEQQILSLYKLAFDQQCPLDTINDVLEIFHDYQLAIDKFYQQENHVIYKKYNTYNTNSSLQCDYETRLALFKLSEQFQDLLEMLLFSLQEVTIRVSLLRWSEIITQQHFLEIGVSADGLLALHPDNDIWKNITQELRALQQVSLETFIEDAQHFSIMRSKRNNEFNSLVFKMTRALAKS